MDMFYGRYQLGFVLDWAESVRSHSSIMSNQEDYAMKQIPVIQ